VGGNLLTVQERARLGRLAREGYTLREMGRIMGRSWSGLRVALRDGRAEVPDPPDVEDFVPRPGRLGLVDREEIVIGLIRGETFTAIAARIGRHTSTVSREVNANGGPGGYRASKADQWARCLARRPKPTKLAACPALAAQVTEWLVELWSPEEIACRLRLEYPDDPMMRVSHETIYQSLFVQGRGELRRELTRCLRSGRAQRRPQHRLEHRGRIPNMVMISQRPAEVEDRAVPGHWEGDLIIGKNGRSAVGTLVERATRFVMLLHLPDDHGAEAVRTAMTAAIKTLPAELARTITWDQGSEMAQHAQFTIDTGVGLYFCDPSSPWQRGTNENTNGLLRQYMPKGTDLSNHSADDLQRIARSLNNRPRETLGWLKPYEKLEELLAQTV
jgi:transposase, IS30 family